MKVVKYTILLLVSLGVSLASFAQDADSVSSHNDIKLILPDSSGWNIIKENEELSFQVHTTDPDPARRARPPPFGRRFAEQGETVCKPKVCYKDR